MPYDEWFTRGAVKLTDRPGLWLKHALHGGHRCGETLALLDEPLGLDAIVEVAETPLGDGVLDLVDRNYRVPVSIGFLQLPGGFKIHDGPTPGVERTAVELREIALVDAGAYRSAFVKHGIARPTNAELATRSVARLAELEMRHLPGLHDQKSHGNWAKKAANLAEKGLPKAAAAKVTRPRKQPARLSARGLADAVRSGVAARTVLTGGDNAVTELVRTNSGATLVHKKVADHRVNGRVTWSAKRQADAEELGALMAEAIGAPAPRVHRSGRDEVHMEFMAGIVARNASRERREAAMNTPAAVRLGLLDMVSQAWDRHTGNWVIDAHGNPVGYDHAFAFDDHRWRLIRDRNGDVSPPNPFNPSFVHHFVGYEPVANARVWRPHPIPAREMARIRARLVALRPTFAKRGQLGWWEDGMAIFDTIAKRGADVAVA
jgi:hypothetical protein